MFQNKKLLQVVFSIAMALLFVKFYLQGKEQNIENAWGMVDVLAAARDIPPHTVLSPGLLMTKRVPIKFLEPGAIVAKIPQEALNRITGKVTDAAIPTGAQIVQSNLMDPSPNETGVAPLLPPGKVGYLLRLGNLDVAALILPGDHINIMATFTVKDKDANSKATYTILQNILVLGVGKVLRPPNQDVQEKKEGSEGLVLTLALDPVEAERLSLAQTESQGEITVVVRPRGDDSVRPIAGVTPAKLLGN